MTDIELSMAVGGTEGVQVSLTTLFDVYMSGGRKLQFSGAISLDAVEVTVDAAMTTDYTRAFGLKALTIDHSELSIGFNTETGIPVHVGIGGGYKWGTVLSGDMDVLVDVVHPEKTVFYGATDGWSLEKTANLVCGSCANAIPKFLALKFGKAYLLVNPGPTAVTFNEEYFPAGAMFSVSNFQISTLLTGSASVNLQGTLESPTSINVRGDFNETDLFDLHLVKLTGSSGSGPFHIYFNLDKNMKASNVDLDARVEFLGAASAGVKLQMAQNSVSIHSDVIVGKRSNALLSLTGDLTLVGSLEKPSDFSFSATFNSRLLDYLSSNSTTSIHNAAVHAHEKLSAAEDAVKKWETEREPLIAKNKAKIAEIIEDDERALSKATQALQHAKADLMRVQARVDSLQSEIDSYNAAKEHCDHWYSFRCHAHNTWEDGKIAAVWTVKEVADAALITAQDAVKVAEEAAEKESRPRPPRCCPYYRKCRHQSRGHRRQSHPQRCRLPPKRRPRRRAVGRRQARHSIQHSERHRCHRVTQRRLGREKGVHFHSNRPRTLPRQGAHVEGA